MGQPPSVPMGFAAVQPWMTDDYVPMGGQRESTDGFARPVVKPLTSCTAVHNQRLLKTDSQAIWSLVKPIGDTPCSRVSHFSIFDSERNRLYIGYGLNDEMQPLNDVWAFDFKLQRWAQLPVHGAEISPRSGARATIISHYIAIFGGYAEKQYFADFHIIDLNTFECSRPVFGGGGPTPRTMPMIAAYEMKIFVWGGYSNGGDRWPNELNILDLNQREWTAIPLDINGRTGFPYIVDGPMVYMHGGSKVENDGMIVLNMADCTIANQRTFGLNINTKLMNSSLVEAGPIFILIGGRADDEYSFAYAFHKERKMWFLFHVIPDGDTVNQSDGDVTKEGLFRLPRNVSVSLVYEENERSVYGFLGAPHSTPPNIFKLGVGEYISYINLQDDLLQAFRSSL